ncbi:MAG: CoA ester lyase [Ignisphaera sp.]|jgi:citrate lyase subunit beta/citryl-CoA lyase|nr:CoA ester lyase [Ignisphaera sp.]
MKYAIFRSLLFVPANNWRLIESAKRALDADAIILDMEDAVPIDDKETARWFVKDAVKELKDVGHTIVVRVNSIASGLAKDDLKFAVQEGVDAIMLPKTESKEDVVVLERMLEEEEKQKSLNPIAIIPLIESARGVLNAYEIASASKRVIAIAFGAADYLRDLGRSYFTLSPDEHELLFPRAQLAIAARSAGIYAIDTPYLGLLIDLKGVQKEAEIALKLGFKGKMCIHPSHVKIINEVFTPSEKEIELARKIVNAYEEAVKRGLGATSVEGRMIDKATYDQAKALLITIEALKEKEKRLGKK